jgi:hypothetical protein
LGSGYKALFIFLIKTFCPKDCFRLKAAPKNPQTKTGFFAKNHYPLRSYKKAMWSPTQISDSGWGYIKQMLKYKCQLHQRKFAQVPPKYSSLE